MVPCCQSLLGGGTIEPCAGRRSPPGASSTAPSEVGNLATGPLRCNVGPATQGERSSGLSRLCPGMPRFSAPARTMRVSFPRNFHAYPRNCYVTAA